MLARKATLVILNDIIGSVLGLIALFFIARELNSHVLGMIGFGLAFVQLYGIITNLGYPKAHVKRVSEGQDLASCNGTYIAIKMVLLVVFDAIILASLFLWTRVLDHGFESSYHLTLVYIMIIWFNLETTSRIFIATFTARLEIAKSQVPRILGNVVRLVGTIYFAITLTSDHPRLYDAALPLAWMYVLGGAVQLVVAIYLFRGYPIAMPTMPLFRSYTRYAIPAIIMTSVVVIVVNTDKVMIQAFWSSRHVGLYTAAQRIAFVIVFLTNAIASILLPSISRHHARGERKEIRTLLNRAERYIMLVALPPIVLFLFLPNRVILILSGKFEEAAPMLQLLSLWALITVVNTPYRNLIAGFDRPGTMAKISAFQASLNVALNFVFIPAALFGIPLFGLNAVGAAIATLVTQAILFVVVRIVAYRLSGVVSALSNGLMLVGALAMGTCLIGLDRLFPANRWFILAAYGLIGLGVYLGTLAVIRQFTRDDLNFFLEAINPREMFGYIKTEVTTRGAVDHEEGRNEKKPDTAPDTGRRRRRSNDGGKGTDPPRRRGKGPRSRAR